MPIILAFCLALALTPAMARAGLALRLQDAPGDLKIHRHPIPLTGGLAVVASAFAAVALLSDELSGLVLSATLIALALGTWDDARPLPVSARLVVQIATGLIVAVNLPQSASEPLLQISIVLLVIATTNAVNLIDGQDGLAGGLTALAAVSMAVAGGPGMEFGHALFALAGAVCAFLIWNRSPARIFLGNGGAYAVGVLLAAGVVQTTLERGWRGLLAAGLCLGVFAFEFTFTVARRLGRGSGLVAGDRFHSYDVLAERHGRTKVTLIFWMAGAAAGALGVLAARLPLVGGLTAITVAAVAGVSAAFWLWPGRSSPEDAQMVAHDTERSMREVGDKT